MGKKNSKNNTISIINDNFFEEEKANEIISSLNKKRKIELIDFLLLNVKNISNKNKISKTTNIANPVLEFEIDNKKFKIIVISKDVLIVLTMSIDNIKTYTKISNLQYEFEDINSKNYIIENSNIISIIKLIEDEFPFKKFYEINPILDISSEKKYIVDNDNEISIGISVSKENIKTSYYPGTPIIIKKAKKKYLIGIIDMFNHFYIFNQKELLDIKTKLDIIEMKSKFTQIEKLNFSNKSIDNNDMTYIFQFNFNNLEYLNLEKSEITK